MRSWPRAEILESRSLPSATLAPGPIRIAADVTNAGPVPGSFTPADIRQAYGINGITFGAGRPGADGSGQTIAIVDAFNDPNIQSDLAVFDNKFGIPAPPQFTVVDQNGPSAPLPRTNAYWAFETSLDVEWAHAIAPGANILLVEANRGTVASLVAAARYAGNQPGVSTVSMSWGFVEFPSEKSRDSTFVVPGVTFVACSGDDGGVLGPQWPATSPNVLSVGGTALSLTSGARTSETAWSFSIWQTIQGYGSGSGGFSAFEPEPAYQAANLPVPYTHRAVPDVAYQASPFPGVAVYDSIPDAGQSGWFAAGGTSVGAPQWAALIAIADQGRALNRLPALSSAQTLNLLYGLAPTIGGSTPSAYFNDITSGHSIYYSAGPGFDLVTGLGSPIANNLVPYLAGTPAPSTASQRGAASQSSSQPVSTAATHPRPIVSGIVNRVRPVLGTIGSLLGDLF
jgi:subtilase family serine protease